MLKIEGLRAGYKGTEALHGISLEIRQGTIVAAVGANGAGKSTLINTLSRLVDINAGAITFDGQNIVRMSAPEVVELGIVQVPEGRQLFSALTVTENLRLGFHRLRGRRTASLFCERLDYVYELFPKLKERADQRAITLSGGEQSMVAIGRALMADPKLLLLDEPSEGLAPVIVQQIGAMIRQIKQRGFTVLLVEQNFRFAQTVADRHYVMEHGRIVDEVANHEL
ncbi:MAG: transporter ATP-binding protein, partial [Rhizobacter sp.]|nr:transporter ATP-binding protein [Rhizobacter sp.]